MFNVSIREYFSVLNVFIVCIHNTAVIKFIPLLCTHVYSYMCTPRERFVWATLTNLAQIHVITIKI